jgi:diguanylate cyclase (GGDEF)-like protein/PAS domain S-box-containing protein
MTIDERLGRHPSRAADPVESALAALVARHPEAIIAGVEDVADGHPRLVPLPAGFERPDGLKADAAAVIDDVVAADRVAVAKAWGRARRRGTAKAAVRLRSDPGHPGALYFFDVRARYGVMVLVFLPGVADASPPVETARPPAGPTRFARATKNEVAVITGTDGALSEILGWPAAELVGRPTLQFVHPDDRETGIEAWMEMLETAGPGRRVRLRHQHRNGRWIWLEVTNHNRLADPEHGDVLCEMLDISEEMAAHEAVRAREQLLAQLTESVPVALFHTNGAGDLLFANRRLQDLTGRPRCRTLQEQLAHVAPEDQNLTSQALAMASAGSDADVSFTIRGDSGIRHCKMSVRPLADASGAVTGLTGCIEDVTDIMRTKLALEVKAASDPLTGCLNREAVLRAIQRLLDRPLHGGPRRGTAVIFIDLDGFKAVNDDLGHAAGDDLLVSLTQRMRGAIRAGDLIGRFGGDEFLVVCPDVTGPSEALAIAENLNRHAFPSTGTAGADAGSLVASVGVAWSDLVALPAARLVQAADAAMYESKRAGRAQPVLSPPVQAE